MRYDMEDISRKIYSDSDYKTPSYSLNQITIQKMKEQCEMSKKQSKTKFNIFAKVAVFCCSICLVTGISITAFSALKTYFWDSSIQFEGDKEIELASDVICKKISENAVISEEHIEMSLQEVEDMVGFSFIENDTASTEQVFYSTGQNENGSLGAIWVYIPDYVHFADYTYISMYITALNEGADKGFELSVSQDAGDPMGGKEFVSQVFSEALNKTVTIYRAGGGIDEIEGELIAVFEYDSVLYRLNGIGVTEEQMIETIQNLK